MAIRVSVPIQNPNTGQTYWQDVGVASETNGGNLRIVLNAIPVAAFSGEPVTLLVNLNDKSKGKGTMKPVDAPAPAPAQTQTSVIRNPPSPDYAPAPTMSNFPDLPDDDDEIPF